MYKGPLAESPTDSYISLDGEFILFDTKNYGKFKSKLLSTKS